MGTSSKGTSNATLAPQQQQQIDLQNRLLANVLAPAYQEVIGGSRQLTGRTLEDTLKAVGNASNVAAQAQEQLGTQGSAALNAGLQGTSGIAGQQGQFGQFAQGLGAQGLANAFDENYANQQRQAALYKPYEQAIADTNALGSAWGGAGQLGSARDALAQQNLGQINALRYSAAAAPIEQQIHNQRIQASNALLNAGQQATGQAQQGYGQLGQFGQQGLQGAQQAAQSQLPLAQAGQGVLGSYANILYGNPAGNANFGSNFKGTQGQSSNKKGFGI